MGDGARAFLIVEPDGPLRNALTMAARRYGNAVTATSVTDAMRSLASMDTLDAIVFNVHLPDGSGFDILRDENVPLVRRASALALSASASPEAANAAFDLGARFLVLPIVEARIARFLAGPSSFEARLVHVVHSWRLRYRLSAGETDILMRSALGEMRTAIAAARDSSELTIKKHVTNMLGRTFDDSLHMAVERVLRETAGAREQEDDLLQI